MMLRAVFVILFLALSFHAGPSLRADPVPVDEYKRGINQARVDIHCYDYRLRLHGYTWRPWFPAMKKAMADIGVTVDLDRPAEPAEFIRGYNNMMAAAIEEREDRDVVGLLMGVRPQDRRRQPRPWLSPPEPRTDAERSALAYGEEKAKADIASGVRRYLASFDRRKPWSPAFRQMLTTHGFVVDELLESEGLFFVLKYNQTIDRSLEKQVGFPLLKVLEDVARGDWRSEEEAAKAREDGRVVMPRTAVRKKIVYVVDATGSMLGTLPFVIDELKRSINQLSESQSVQVIAYRGDEVIEFPFRALLPVASETRRALFDWLELESGHLTPQGDGHVVAALERAHALKPDLIFVLAGDVLGAGRRALPKEKLFESLASMQAKHKVKVNCIQFIDRKDHEVFQAIAERTRGLYKHVNAADLGIVPGDGPHGK